MLLHVGRQLNNDSLGAFTSDQFDPDFKSRQIIVMKLTPDYCIFRKDDRERGYERKEEQWHLKIKLFIHSEIVHLL